MLANIQRMADHYYQMLPTNIPRTVGASALFSFAVTVFINGGGKPTIDLNPAFFAAAIAATASVIHALVTPIFKELSSYGCHNTSYDIFSWAMNVATEFAHMIVVDAVASAFIQTVSNSSSTVFTFYRPFSINYGRAAVGIQNPDNAEYIYLSSRL